MDLDIGPPFWTLILDLLYGPRFWTSFMDPDIVTSVRFPPQLPPVESAASRANQLVRKAGDHPSLPFKSTPLLCSTLVGTRRATTIAECALLRRRRGDPTQGKRVPEVPRSPRGVLVNSTLDAADTGPDRAIIMFVASPTLSKCPV